MSELADALRDVAQTLRHHRDLGMTEITRAVSATPPPPAVDPASALAAQEAALQGCTLCKLCHSRTTIAFGSGSPRARLMVVGEGPGEEEDKQGKPFVGRAGQLLTKMLESVGFDRERDAYIANVVKCRPERNRNPEPDEVAACNPFLMAQLDTVRPAVILALGNFAVQTLLGTREGITKLRGRLYEYRDSVLVPTFHPAFLLRNPGPEYRRMAWDDLKLARREFDRLSAAPPPNSLP
ncbi:MAG TPA: uracil-DNA glycosylase [Methylomirabilota bacterium]|nr:uracil-DNA glycosylase [Methylomirabilota bacterium]